MLQRTKAETTALIHERVTEIYQIMRGRARSQRAERCSDAKPRTSRRVGAGMSHPGSTAGGDRPERVKANDIVIVPAGRRAPLHPVGRSNQYIVYRFEPSGEAARRVADR